MAIDLYGLPTNFLLTSLAVTYRRMNLPPSARQVTDPQRLTAHLYSTLRRLHSYLHYIRFVKYVIATENLAANYKKSTLPDWALEPDTMLSSRSIYDRYYLSPANTIAPMHIPCTQHTHRLHNKNNNYSHPTHIMYITSNHHTHVHPSCVGGCGLSPSRVLAGQALPGLSVLLGGNEWGWGGGAAYMAVGHVSPVYHFALNQYYVHNVPST